MGWAYVLQADLEAGRLAGTLPPEVSDEQALERIAASLRARLVGSGKFVEGQVAVEPEGRLSVTFVGRMGEAYDRLLIAGLTDSGRLTCYALATDADVEGGLAPERARFDAWRAANPEAPAGQFDWLPVEAGGPAAGLVWRPRYDGGEPLPLLRETARMFTRADADPTGGKFKMVHDEHGPAGFQYAVGEEALPIVSAYLRARTGRELYFVVNGAVHAAFEPGEDWDGIVKVRRGFDLDSVRGFLFAFSGEPFLAPVRFVEFDKRQLRNVRLDGEDPEVIRIPDPGAETDR